MAPRFGPAIKVLAAIAALVILGLGVASSVGRTPRRAVPASLQATVPHSENVRRVVELSDAFIAISEAVTPAVVRIQAERVGRPGHRFLPPGLRDFFTPPPDHPDVPQVAGGTGFIVSEDGYILTNAHVIDGADRITVALVDRRVFPAEVVGADPTTDVAVVKINAASLPTVRFGDSDEARVGEWVLAIGNPGFEASTLDFTVTSGIISAKGRPLRILGEQIRDDTSSALYVIEDFIQTDAAINPGNSGGPLVNLRGEVIGINTAIASDDGFYQGYGFAIPANLARRVASDLIEYGQVRRAVIGVQIAQVDAEDAEVYGLPQIAGARVDDFTEASPARAAGLERHDVIVAVDGQPVDRVGQLQRLIAQHHPGEMVSVSVIRYGQPREFRMQLAQGPTTAPRTPAGAPRTAKGHLGLRVGALSAMDAHETRLGNGTSGAFILEVDETGPAARKGIRRGDRILAIDRKPITSVREAENALRRLRSGAVVSFELQDPGGRVYIANVRVP